MLINNHTEALATHNLVAVFSNQVQTHTHVYNSVEGICNRSLVPRLSWVGGESSLLSLYTQLSSCQPRYSYI